MRILLDKCIPRQLRKHIVGHDVATVASAGWGGIKNGKLLDLADTRFDILLTVDRSIPYQQNLRNRQIAVIVLIAPNNKLETLQPFLSPFLSDVLAALEAIQPGEVAHMDQTRR
ncbi:MAG: DUF5615 family PIN-like protein [Chloroflexia bacterium]